MKYIHRIRIAVFSLLMAAMPFQLHAEEMEHAPAAWQEGRCTVGMVPQFEQRRLFATWRPIVTRLQEKTGCAFELIGSKSIAEFEKAFVAGAYDFVYMNPYHAIMANDAQGYLPIVRSGAKKLKGILVVPKDSPVRDVKELDGQTLAFPSPNALGASLMMRAELATLHGLNITPLYVKTHSSVYLHVAKNLNPAGGGVMRTFKGQDAQIRNRLRVLYTTREVYAHPFAAHPRVPESLRDAVQAAWLALAEAEPALFDGIPMKDSIATSMTDYENLRSMGLEKFVGK